MIENCRELIKIVDYFVANNVEKISEKLVSSNESN
jgi:hypothetical protein